MSEIVARNLNIEYSLSVLKAYSYD